MDAHRRHVLAMLGAASTLLAGCSDLADEGDQSLETNDDEDSEESNADDDTNGADEDETDEETTPAWLEGGELPSYASVLPPADALVDGETTSREYFVTAVDLATIVGTLDDDPGEGSVPDDPLLQNPIAVVSLGIYGLFALGSSPIAQVQAEAEGESDDAALVYVDGAYALYGAYDLETARSGLKGEGYELQAEAEDGADDFVVFADDASSEVVGVTEEAFVYAFGSDQARSLAVVSAIVETNVGSQSPAHESNATVETLLRAGANTGITSCLTGGGEPLTDLEPGDQVQEDDVAFDFSPFEGATGVVQGLQLAEDESDARVIVTYESEAAVNVDRLESGLGGEARSFDLETGGSAALVTAVYGTDPIEE
ncbi:hypothetical protein [Natronosalvus caseinilyticus]|uniref:hypothetical protein n=1 Tax=Natronosalvus caseinilyticus TaxID=2953747 RepID=UPI0028ABF028|nr:hypothetical protein [Natronosalvus caseinilyticus]